MSVEVGSPVAGLAAALGEVPDPVFSQAMVGPGMAIKPSG
ncbi:PTS glucose transporter subunit IIA, partial [Saccharopolyspora indica]